MTHFKTSKAELLFVVLPKDAMNVCIDDNDICFIQKCITKYIGINKGYTLLGKLSEVSEEVAKGLVDDVPNASDYPKTYQYARHSLDLIATHLGLDTNDNIYLLNKIHQ